MTRILLGDCLVVLAALPPGTLDACVTDPPYELGFMGKGWDATGIAFRVETWRAVRRVLKPGAHLLACGGTRTAHRMTCAIEDAGFEIRDSIAWLYGSGFPKSVNLGAGRGTGLKPAHEPIVLARNPFPGTLTAHVERHGTGALNIDACRVGAAGGERAHIIAEDKGLARNTYNSTDSGGSYHAGTFDLARWPANVILDPSAAAVLDAQSGEGGGGDGIAMPSERRGGNSTDFAMGLGGTTAYADVGGASRFFYVAKPSREERDLGCGGLARKSPGACTDRVDGSAGLENPRAGAGRTGGGHNFHPTVKPVELMRWLVRLVTPPGGCVIDPFLGSGTTGMACRYEGLDFLGIEREPEYLAIAGARLAAVLPLFDPVEVIG